MSGSVRELKTQLGDLAAKGLTAALGGACGLDHEVPGLAGAAVTRFDGLRHNTDSVVLSPVRCGDTRGLLGVVCGGNEKDEASAVACGAAAVAFLEGFERPLLSEADVVPALRRSMLAAESSIRSIVENDPEGFPAETVVGPRSNLSGIGTCITALVALPGSLFVVHLGDSSAFVRRESTTRRLTVAHTLRHDPRFRERAEQEPNLEQHQGVVLGVLGSGSEPQMDLTRLALLPGDQIIAGNVLLPLILDEHQDLPSQAAGACDALASFADERRGWSPATLVVLSADR